jgi:hypothetical protein
MKTKTFITIEEALKRGNDGKNQDIKGKFVQREIYCNVGSLVEYCLSKGYEDSESPVSLDSISNYYSYPEYRGEYANFEGGTDEKRQTEIERLKELATGDEEVTAQIDFNDLGILEGEIEDLENLETEPQEIFEWWAVSSWLAEKLEAMGYCTVDTGSCHVWGRTTTGQAILLDYAITRICAEMGILEGQENEW